MCRSGGLFVRGATPVVCGKIAARFRGTAATPQPPYTFVGPATTDIWQTKQWTVNDPLKGPEYAGDKGALLRSKLPPGSWACS